MRKSQNNKISESKITNLAFKDAELVSRKRRYISVRERMFDKRLK